MNLLKVNFLNIRRGLLFGSIALFFLAAGGCTELERSGYSTIPQNSPGSWELNPYGDMKN